MAYDDLFQYLNIQNYTDSPRSEGDNQEITETPGALATVHTVHELPVRIKPKRKEGIEMKPTTKSFNYSAATDESHTGPSVIKIPTNDQVNEINDNPKLSDEMKHDLMKLHKQHESLKNLILSDTTKCDVTMRSQELKGLKMPYHWSSYLLEDVVVLQRDDASDFLADMAMRGYEPDHNYPDSIKNIIGTILYFTVRSLTDDTMVLSELYFYDVVYQTEFGITRDMKIRFE